jgi:hypothetical protein
VKFIGSTKVLGDVYVIRRIHFNFPTVLRDKAARDEWTKLVSLFILLIYKYRSKPINYIMAPIQINRKDPKDPRKNWVPRNHSRVCSRHFVDGKPTEKNPHPCLHLGKSTTFHRDI